MSATAQTPIPQDLENRIREQTAGRVKNLKVIQRGDRLILEGLSQTFYAKQLAQHCTLENLSDGNVALRLSEEYKHLQANRIAIDKLQAALNDYFAKPMKLNIVVGKTETVTPAAIEQQARQHRQKQADDSITQDEFVRQAQAELGASLVPESIKPIQQEDKKC